MQTYTTTAKQQAATDLLNSKTLSSEAGKSRLVTVGKTCIYQNDGEFYSAVSNADCAYFRIYEVQDNGLTVLCYSAHEYWTAKNGRRFSPNFTCSSTELARLFDQYTEEGVFAYVRDMTSLRILKK